MVWEKVIELNSDVPVCIEVLFNDTGFETVCTFVSQQHDWLQTIDMSVFVQVAKSRSRR